MRPGGTTELIWHFAGYLHISEDLKLPRILYELGGETQGSPDYDPNGKHSSAKLPDAVVPESTPSPELYWDDVIGIDFRGSFKALKFGAMPHHSHAESHPTTLPDPPPLPLLGGGAGPHGGLGGIIWPDITIEYGCWAPQRLIYAEQKKFMLDNDTLLVTGGTDPGDMHGIDEVGILEGMLDMAQAEVPASLHVPLQNQNATAEFIHDHHAAIAEQGPPDPDAAQVGLWIDNMLQPLGTEHPEFTPLPKHSFELPNSDGTVAGVAATLGSNVQGNLAQIVDYNEAVQNLWVLGDYFTTNAIVQTNVYRDNDHVSHAGPEGSAVLSPDANLARNIAEFVAKEAIPAGYNAFAGPNWHVDILDGDFLDVKTLVQQNWMMDGDVTVQTTSGAYARVLTGGNTQVSLGSYFDLKHYDVIIVCGDYHEANLIFQKNILLDDDIIMVAADLGAGHEGFAQGLSWKGNTLLNDATISNLGTQTNLPVSDEMLDLVTLLGAGETTDLDSSFGWMMDGNGTGQLNILYVTGSYYDINMVTQINLLGDVDTAIQYLPDVTPPRDDQREMGDALQQTASTGGNTLVNFAEIVDVGTMVSQHIDGEYYEDTILIQTNIIVGDDDEVTNADTATLVPEVIAFTGDGEDEASDPHHTIEPVKDILAQSDVIGGVLN